MDSRFALLCLALLAGQVHGFPSSDESKEEVGKVPSSSPLDTVDGVTSKRSPDQLDDQKVAIELPITPTKLDVRFPEDSKQMIPPAEGGENARSKKSASLEDTFRSPHTTTVCIQVRSDHRPEVVCGPQVGEQKDDKVSQTPMARYAYSPPQMPFSGQGYYDPNRQRPIYGPAATFDLPAPRPFIMRSTPEKPQYISPTPMRASGPYQQQFPAQAQSSPQKFVQDLPSQMASQQKSEPAAGRGGPIAPVVYFRTAEEETNSIKPAEEKYQPAPAHPVPQIGMNTIKVVPPSAIYYTTPSIALQPPSYRFNCALQPELYGLSNVLRSASAPVAGQAYYQPSPAAWGNPLDVLFGRSAETQKPYGDASYYDLQGIQAQSSNQMLGSSVPYASGYSYDIGNSLYGNEAEAYSMAGRSAMASSDVQRQWEQEEYMRMLGASAGGMSFEELSARAAQQKYELDESKQKLQQMQQQLKDIEQRAASAVPDDKDRDGKKDILKDSASAVPSEIPISLQKTEVKQPVPAKKRRSNNA